MTVTWEEPPPLQLGVLDYQGIALQLRERPGQWARVGEGLTYIPMNRVYAGLRAVGVQTSRRRQPDGETYDLYGRWPEQQ